MNLDQPYGNTPTKADTRQAMGNTTLTTCTIVNGYPECKAPETTEDAGELGQCWDEYKEADVNIVC